MRNHLVLLVCLLGTLSMASIVVSAQSEQPVFDEEHAFRTQLQATVGQRVWVHYYESGRIGMDFISDTGVPNHGYEFWVRGVGKNFVKLGSEDRVLAVPFHSITRLTWR